MLTSIILILFFTCSFSFMKYLSLICIVLKKKNIPLIVFPPILCAILHFLTLFLKKIYGEAAQCLRSKYEYVYLEWLYTYYNRIDY